MQLHISLNNNNDFLYNILCIKLNINLIKIPNSIFFIIKNNANELFGIYRLCYSVENNNKNYYLNGTWIDSSINNSDIHIKMIQNILNYITEQKFTSLEITEFID